MFIEEKNKGIRKPRILHAPIVALYQPYLYVKGLREIGYEADYMVFSFNNDRWLARDSDIDLDSHGTLGLQIEKTRELEFLLYAIDNYDIFHFHSGFSLFNPSYSLWSRLSEIKLLKKLGKKVVISWWGCDLRTEEVDINYKYSACSECVESTRNWCRNSTEKRDAIKRAFEYADINLSNGDLVSSYKGVKWIDNAIDCNEWKPIQKEEIPEEYRLEESDNLRIYHSFGNSSLRGDVKGTEYIKEAVNRLREEGHKVEFIFFDNVPNKDIKYYQAQADIVVDQLRAGWHGSTAMECMAMGKPVITYIRPEVEAALPHHHPLINANINNVYEVLKGIINNRDSIKLIGEQSRQYCHEFHSYINIAKELANIYNGNL